jgi:hypothetical protein
MRQWGNPQGGIIMKEKKGKVLNTAGQELTDEELQALATDPKVAQFIAGVAARAVPPQGMSNVDIFIAEVREAHTQGEWDKAITWVMRVFAPLIRVPEKGEPVIVFALITSSARTRKQGLTRAPDGFLITRSLDVDKMAGYYIEQILEEGLTDEQRIWNMIEYSRTNPHGGTTSAGELHPEWNFLIGKDAAGHEKVELYTHVYK